MGREHCARPGGCCCPLTGALSSAPPAAAARGSADGQWAQRRRPAAGTVQRRVSRLRHGPISDLTHWRRPAQPCLCSFPRDACPSNYTWHYGNSRVAPISASRCPHKPTLSLSARGLQKQTAFDPALCMPTCTISMSPSRPPRRPANGWILCPHCPAAGRHGRLGLVPSCPSIHTHPSNPSTL